MPPPCRRKRPLICRTCITQRAWDFDGRQDGDQFNVTLVKQSSAGTLTLFFNYSDKIEPNEDSTVHLAGESSAPYTRPFHYPDFNAALGYLSPTGATAAAAGNNCRNYYSDAQRTDYRGHVKFDANLSDKLTWSNQLYYHGDDGVGVAGLPSRFGVYYPNQNLKQVFGNSSYAVRTTEYASTAAACCRPCATSWAITRSNSAAGWNTSARKRIGAGMRSM